jgi:hypothetical protein
LHPTSDIGFSEWDSLFQVAELCFVFVDRTFRVELCGDRMGLIVLHLNPAIWETIAAAGWWLLSFGDVDSKTAPSNC